MYDTGFGKNTCWFKHSGPGLIPCLDNSLLTIFFQGADFASTQLRPFDEVSSY